MGMIMDQCTAKTARMRFYKKNIHCNLDASANWHVLLMEELNNFSKTYVILFHLQLIDSYFKRLISHILYFIDCIFPCGNWCRIEEISKSSKGTWMETTWEGIEGKTRYSRIRDSNAGTSDTRIITFRGTEELDSDLNGPISRNKFVVSFTCTHSHV